MYHVLNDPVRDKRNNAVWLKALLLVLTDGGNSNLAPKIRSMKANSRSKRNRDEKKESTQKIDERRNAKRATLEGNDTWKNRKELFIERKTPRKDMGLEQNEVKKRKESKCGRGEQNRGARGSLKREKNFKTYVGTLTLRCTSWSPVPAVRPELVSLGKPRPRSKRTESG